MGRYRALILRAGKTKTGTMRIGSVGQRLSAALDALRTDRAGEPLGPAAFVFGTELGVVSSVKTAWRTACKKAGLADLHFLRLRREFACRLLEVRAELHDVRDFLGHGNITTTTPYLRSTTLKAGTCPSSSRRSMTRVCTRRLSRPLKYWCLTARLQPKSTTSLTRNFLS